MKVFTVFKSLLTYKEPKDIEGFELLEDDYEENGQEKETHTGSKKEDYKDEKG